MIDESLDVSHPTRIPASEYDLESELVVTVFLYPNDNIGRGFSVSFEGKEWKIGW